MEEKKSRGLSASFVTGAIALIFLIVGFQIALFINKAAISKVEADRSAPDTVYIVAPSAENPGGALSSSSTAASAESSGRTGTNSALSPVTGASRKPKSTADASGRPKSVADASGRPKSVADASGKPKITTGKGFQKTYEATAPRTVESFRFNPNTVSIEDLQRLGFSQKQAQSIENYRAKGGTFRRKSDFAKSFVVSDSVYSRLEPFIDIPLVELNAADSAAFDALPGIGGYFAAKMVEFRRLLGGYSYKEQLLDIYRFDEEKFDALKDLITVNPDLARPYPLWTLPEDSLALHPYIGKYSARSIVFFRENNDPAEWTLEAIGRAGILKAGMAEKLAKCKIEPPDNGGPKP